MSDLPERLKAAAVAAIEDLAPAVMADPSKLRLLTIEIELANGGTVRGGRAWLERTVNLRTLLEQGPPAPVAAGEGLT
jgi:hypothetical protein